MQRDVCSHYSWKRGQGSDFRPNFAVISAKRGWMQGGLRVPAAGYSKVAKETLWPLSAGDSHHASFYNTLSPPSNVLLYQLKKPKEGPREKGSSGTEHATAMAPLLLTLSTTFIRSLSLSCPVTNDRPNNSTLLQLNRVRSMAEVIPYGAVSNIVLGFLASPILSP
ncbi:Uncharacterized protein TCM_031023 [Theobroma cacao]|uniref:Uncharacterized protein n=1 Tax=Theobroma cacao TaxID=3641 RepID=A0A061F6L4_THECC|nr:Uncharacterized protein TCM_031023 [Theobroma cacao]